MARPWPGGARARRRLRCVSTPSSTWPCDARWGSSSRTGVPPSRLDWADLDAETISAFLDHLETDRHNSTRTRNAGLTAIRALFAYAALRHPERAAGIARVLTIPAKRFDKATVSYLTGDEVTGLLTAADGKGDATTP